jgi:hypothetical protein
MATLNERRKTMVEFIVLSPRWPGDVENPLDENGGVGNINNLDLIKKELERISDNDVFGESEAHKLIMKLRNKGNAEGETLIRKTTVVHQVAPVVDPALNLPHDDLPQLKNIRNLSDVQRVKNLPKDRLKQFMYLKPPKPGVASVPFEFLNERMRYIIDHKLEGPGTVSEEKTATVRKPVFSVPPEITQSHELVEAMTLADIGSVSSNEGRRTTLAKRQKQFHADIDFAHANRVSAKQILQDTKDAIKKSGESSIS